MIGDSANGQLILSGDRKIPCRMRYSERAHRMRLTLSAENGLTVTLPLGTSGRTGEDFVRASIPWIERTWLKLARKQRRIAALPRFFPEEFHFPVTGEHFPIRYEWRAVCWTGAREENGCLKLTGQVLDAECVHEALERYLIRKAGQVLEPMLRTLAAEYDFHPGNVSIRFQRGRWGSCSPARDISLNAQMLFLEPEEVRYILIHELCHTREMNHSDRFWREVGRCCSDFRRIRGSLKRVRPELWR